MTTTLPEPTVSAEESARRPVFRSGHLLVANSALTAISGLVYWLLAARLYDAEDLGRNLAAIAAITLLGGVAQANVMTALLRFVPCSGAASRRIVGRGYLVAILLTAGAGSAFVAGLELWSEDLLFLSDDSVLAVWFVISVTVWALFSIQDHVLTAVRRAGVVPLENLVFAALKLVLLVAFAAAAPAAGILLSWTVAAAGAVTITSGYVFFRALPAHMSERPVETPPSFRTMGRFLALDYLASLFLFVAVSGLPLLVIDRVGPTATAGFLLAWTITYSLYLVPLAMGQSLVAHSADPGAEVGRDGRALLGHTLMLVVPAVVVLVAFAPQILGLFGGEYLEHDTTLRLLALSAIPNVAIEICVSSAQVRQRMRVVVATRMAQCAGVVGLSVLLIPRQGVLGVAVAWLVAQAVVGAVIVTGTARQPRRAAVLAPVAPAGAPASPVPTVEVSVVICCYTERRWDQVLAAAISLRTQTVAPLEVLVVIDHNPDLLTRLVAELPWARVTASTGRRGLSGARNTGVALARGEVVAFLDDDAVAAPEWVGAQAAAYAAPNVVGTAAAVDPLWATERPVWFPPEFDWVVGCTWVGLTAEATESADVRNAIGAGMSLRRAAVLAAGGFDEGLGRVDTVPVGCEETELCIRLRAADPAARIVTVPGARTKHHLSPDRETFRYFWSRCWAEGTSKAGVAQRAGGRALGTERAYVTRVLPRGFFRALADRRPRRALALLVGLGATAGGYVAAQLCPRAEVRARLQATAGILAASLPLVGALTVWLLSLPGTDPAGMTDLGLVSVLPAAWFVSLGGIVVLLGLHIARGSRGVAIAAHLAGAVTLLHATPALLYPEPRYSWTFKHLGVVDYISRNGSVDPSDATLGVYHSWPGFFTLSAFLSETAGIDAADLARWAPLFFQLAFLVPALVAFRVLSDDPRRVWLGLSLFALTNWVGQDYFAPQALTFLLFLSMVALVLRWRPDTPRGTVLLALILMLAVAGSHQLTPPVLLGVLIVLAIRPGFAPRWIPLAMGVFTAAWMATLGRDYLATHSAGLLATLGRPDSNAAESLATADVPEQQVVIWAGRALVIAVAALATYGFLRDRRTASSWTLALLALAPAPLVVSSYDGEIVFRVYLFALPWLALLAAGSLFRASRQGRRALASIALLLALAAPFTLAYYGKERANFFNAEERAANDWVLEHAEPGSVLVGAALDFPWKDRGYERFSYAWLSELPIELRRELPTDAARIVIDVMGESGAFTGYLLLSDAQDAALDYGTDLSHEVQDAIAGGVLASGEFEVVYATSGAMVLRHEFVVEESREEVAP